MKIKLSINNKIVDKNLNGENPTTMQGYYSINSKDFIDKVIKKGLAWSGGRYKDNYRNKKAFISAEIIGIDVDDNWDLQKVFHDDFTKKNALLIYTSPSHTKKHNKFRIVFKLPKVVLDIATLERVILQLITYYNADKKCRDCSRFFFGNTKAKVKYFGNELTDRIPVKVEIKKIKEKSEFDNIECSLSNKNSLSEMLNIICKVIPRLDYEQWLTLCSSVWSVFSYKESVELLQQYYPEDCIEDYKYKYEHKLDTIPYTYLIKLAVKCGFKVPDFSDFVRIDAKGKMITTPVSLESFLTANGFFTYFYNNNELDYQLIREKESILIETGIKKTYEYLVEYVRGKYSRFDGDDIVNYLVGSNMVSKKTINILSSPKVSLHTDTIDTSNFYFKNGYLQIKGNEIEFIDSYEHIKPHKLWGTSILAREYYIDEKKSVFEQFVINICNKESDRVDILKGVIGYTLHRYKNPNINKCVVLNDEKINIDNPSGRTGKSLIAEAIGHVRKLGFIDGRSFNFNDRFRFQNLDLSTEVVNMDDVPANFNLKNFYSILSGSLKIEEKGEKAIIRPFETSPKFLFSSNYTVDTGGGSDRARVVEVSLYNCYNEYYQPKHEFGHMFFIDWDQKEWNRFYTFCAQCVQQYLSMGMLYTISTSLMANKLRKQTGEHFTTWVTNYDFYKNDKAFYTTKELYADFLNFAKNDEEFEMTTIKSFGMSLKIFFNVMEIPFQKKCVREHSKIMWGYEILNR